REIVRAACNRFIEMPAETIREKTFCCGAGGGLLTDEVMPIRMAGGKPRAMAVKHVGANFVATPCAICKAQLPEVMKYWDVPAEVGGVVQLLGNALKL
ncbi:MAG: heterodisulfide reductase-related iron-sulfur binding cluster, partial [Anaerolineae bacterium]